MSVRTGVDRFAEEGEFASCARFALVTNDGACNTAFIPSRLALVESGHRIVKLFSPEHGLQAVGPDGHAMASGSDALTGLPVTSLYGDALKPSKQDLEYIDAVLFDLPDVGCRCYTYLWTLSYVMEACEEQGKPLIVLDRPNPISGILSLAEGPMLADPRCASFIGRWNIPLRHSCTFGELAQLWKATRIQNLDLRVVRVNGWSRQMFYHDWGSSFVPTSPAMANAEACLLYPGLCLSEGVNLSEGRGTPQAFRVLGSPWMRAAEVAAEFNRLGLPGVAGRAVTFVPEIGKYRGQGCNGVMLHATDVRQIRPVLSAMILIKLIRDLHCDAFAWSTYPTHVNPQGTGHLDKLLGVAHAELLFEQPWDLFRNSLEPLLACPEWPSQVEGHLLYL
jgi:uncharacterized protein YbbC (DUF1343 family)